ncbi:MAG TPA: amino acid permease, partial [Caulobacteraceae bacterium]|nr:amino acid permease [Caulobacteraceae bacterium]
MKLFAKKPIELLLAQAAEEGDHTLKRALGPFGLTMLGIGSIIGAGIFILTGQQAAINAGPAILLSFVLAGITCAAAALCYAELSSMIPVSGSAYTYAYATLGEFVAWIIAWDLIIEYLFAASTVAAGWSGHLADLLAGFGLTFPAEWAGAPYSFDGKHFVPTGRILNVPAIGIVALMAGVLISGITESATVNNAIVMLKVAIVVIVIAFGIAFINPSLWHPFIPKEVVDDNGVHHFGLKGILSAAGVIFFAYIGFETVSTAAQEAKDPQRTMPIGILASLAICTVLYITMSLVITGLAPYATLNNAHPVSAALSTHPELQWLRQVVNIGVAVGLGSTILTLLYGQSRIFYSMSRDGLLPSFFGRLMKGRRTPWIGTIITAAAAALAAGLLPLDVLGELVSIGTLFAFALICAAVMYLRIVRPELTRAFKTPFWPVTATIGILSCLWLISGLGTPTLLRLVVWMVVGLVVYFGWAYWHSRRQEKRAAEAAAAPAAELQRRGGSARPAPCCRST